MTSQLSSLEAFFSRGAAASCEIRADRLRRFLFRLLVDMNKMAAKTPRMVETLAADPTFKERLNATFPQMCRQMVPMFVAPPAI